MCTSGTTGYASAIQSPNLRKLAPISAKRANDQNTEISIGTFEPLITCSGLVNDNRASRCEGAACFATHSFI